jgi:hypothetical protein
MIRFLYFWFDLVVFDDFESIFDVHPQIKRIISNNLITRGTKAPGIAVPLTLVWLKNFSIPFRTTPTS